MNSDSPLAEFEFSDGARLTLYPNRVVHADGSAMETVPLAQLAAVRIAFEREAGKLNWAIVLALIALALYALSGPLQGWAGAVAAELAEQARPGSAGGGVPGVLLASFRTLGAIASLLPALAAALAACGAALLAFYWLGLTTLTLSFAAVERAYPARGRNRQLVDFAAALSERLARLGK